MAHLLVLAGGFGTRLREAVAEVPKPLAPVAGYPYLHYLNAHWLAQGVTELTYLLHYQADMIEAFLAGEQLGVSVNTVVEPEPMGTGGAIAYAVRSLNIKGSFLVANADTWLGGGVGEVAAMPAPAMATLQVPNVERYGNVEIADGRVVCFREKQHSQGDGWINAGLYHLHSDMFADWDGKPFSIERDVFPHLAEHGRLRSVPLLEEFIDIGVPDDYFRFCRWIESGKREVL
ncbi:MAG: sugar phosphate nucleotidyltransferase [Oxalicibacterium faecigallinarum]|uniref:sugar phosphate nucleotidyltransferase n=1 Tax=Oxalicibacterium faecigallinarum TaxID=573741 RepID=UPI002807DB02|nr:sugar phosphate nucleotidyltransferase [Oxalicibacterium faecigallinarum]MDQ7969614.1 sugar phosphate nucleotidyltransferase [Oxalicibacterium faecigallinarum]